MRIKSIVEMGSALSMRSRDRGFLRHIKHRSQFYRKQRIPRVPSPLPSLVEMAQDDSSIAAPDWGRGDGLLNAVECEPELEPVECLICCSAFVGDAAKTRLIYPCATCRKPQCIECVKTTFLAACKDESRMPPQCCSIFQLVLARPYLTEEETSLYKAKFEEWSTKDRLYCPRPTCSVFIPNRLRPDPRQSEPIQPSKPETRGDFKSVVEPPKVTFGTGVVMEVHETASAAPQTMPCPTCGIPICLACKQIEHPGTPCQADIDPTLAALLKRWKIKRCPKCRTGIRKMFGCEHVLCRCGAQWCWGCSMPICLCVCSQESQDEQDDGDNDDDDDDDSEVSDVGEDLDRGEWNDGQGDFGRDPGESRQMDPSSCTHYWSRALGNRNKTFGGGMDCNRCWVEIFTGADIAAMRQAEPGPLGQPGEPTTREEAVDDPRTAWYCVDGCGLKICGRCVAVEAQKDPGRVDDRAEALAAEGSMPVPEAYL